VAAAPEQVAASGEPFDPRAESDESVRTRVLRVFLEREAARWSRQVTADGSADPVVL
jgi:hypothetical protein